MDRLCFLVLLVSASLAGNLKMLKWPDGKTDTLEIGKGKSVYYMISPGDSVSFDQLRKLYARVPQLGSLHRIARLQVLLNGKEMKKDLPLLGESNSPLGRISISRVWKWDRPRQVSVKNISTQPSRSFFR